MSLKKYREKRRLAIQGQRNRLKNRGVQIFYLIITNLSVIQWKFSKLIGLFQKFKGAMHPLTQPCSYKAASLKTAFVTVIEVLFLLVEGKNPILCTFYTKTFTKCFSKIMSTIC